MSIGEVLTRALSDTLMGMGTVFSILIVISLVISLFKFIPKADKEHSTVTEKTKAREADELLKNKADGASPDEEEDDEIAAVIMAAIRMAREREQMLYEGASEGSFAEPTYIVRSITRRR